MLKLLPLLILTWHVSTEVPTNEERKAIVECHTKLREHVNPPASNMMLMNYSTEMETLAVKHLADCRPPANQEAFQGTSELLIHELPDKSQYVQELCKVNGNDYNYEKNDCSGSCSEYYQMVWAASTQVGCALKACPSRGDASKPKYELVCIYKLSDNSVAERPYESGRSCSRCPDGYGCQRNQCYKGALATTATSIAMTTTSIGTVLSTIEALIFAMILLHWVE
uniref:SCP domain-containing protein n=1 Tax=Mesocestoides corti TaxID=53468 RepID=A0A5K3FUL7_MESCO